MINIDDFFARPGNLEAEGKLTIKDIIMPGYYRLLEGEYAGTVYLDLGR